MLKIQSIAMAVFAIAIAAAADSSPTLGKWVFTGKDNTGLAWSGTLKIQTLDRVRFQGMDHYFALCTLEVESTDPSKGTKGVEAPCEWKSGTRTLSFGDTWPAVDVYTAVLSADGKLLEQGKWTERKMARGQLGPVVRSGQWTAKVTRQ